MSDELGMALRMHDVQFERANRLETEVARLTHLLDASERIRTGYVEQKERLRAQRDDYSRVLGSVRSALLEGGQDAASRCRKALLEMDAWAAVEPATGSTVDDVALLAGAKAIHATVESLFVKNGRGIVWDSPLTNREAYIEQARACIAAAHGGEAPEGSVRSWKVAYDQLEAIQDRLVTRELFEAVLRDRDLLRATVARVRALARYESDAIPEAFYIDGDSLDEALDVASPDPEPLDDEAIDTDIASVIDGWFDRGHDVFTTDEVCAAYVRGYKTGTSR